MTLIEQVTGSPAPMQKARPRDADGDGGIIAEAAETEVVKARWNEAAHPRGLDGRFVEVLGGLTYTGTVHAHVPRTDAFAGTHVADVQEIHDDETATVSLHLDEDHPAVRDAVRDGAVSGADEFEAVTRLPLKRVKANNDTVPLTRPARNALQARAARRKQRARAEEARRNREEYLADRKDRFPSLLPELASQRRIRIG